MEICDLFFMRPREPSQTFINLPFSWFMPMPNPDFRTVLFPSVWLMKLLDYKLLLVLIIPAVQSGSILNHPTKSCQIFCVFWRHLKNIKASLECPASWSPSGHLMPRKAYKKDAKAKAVPCCCPFPYTLGIQRFHLIIMVNNHWWASLMRFV